jgi:hypothetical protein
LFLGSLAKQFMVFSLVDDLVTWVSCFFIGKDELKLLLAIWDEKFRGL